MLPEHSKKPKSEGEIRRIQYIKQRAQTIVQLMAVSNYPNKRFNRKGCTTVVLYPKLLISNANWGLHKQILRRITNYEVRTIAYLPPRPLYTLKLIAV